MKLVSPDSGGGGTDLPFTGNPYIEGVRAFVRGVRLLDALPFGDSSIQQANRQAARDAGYTGTRDQLNAIGEGLRNAAVFAAGQGGGPGDFNRAGPSAAVTRAPPRPTVPEFPSGAQGGPIRNPPTTYDPGMDPTPPWNPPPLPRSPIPAPPAGVPNVGVLLDPSIILENVKVFNDVLTGGIWSAVFGPQPIPKGPPTRRGPRGGNTNDGNPFPPNGPPTRVVVVNQFPESRADRVQARIDSLGGDIFVSTRRLPIPAPVPAPPPPKPLWQTLLPIAIPALLPFLRPDQGDKNVLRLTDPLTQPQSGLTGSNPYPVAYGSPWGGGPGTPGTNTCECKAPPKKRRKKKRTVCYSGTYIERADGTRKTKKRKVKCT